MLLTAHGIFLKTEVCNCEQNQMLPKNFTVGKKPLFLRLIVQHVFWVTYFCVHPIEIKKEKTT